MSMRVMTQLFVGLLWAVVLLVSPMLAPADQATYIYDDLGRLSQMIDGQGNVATYTYDAVGNLLSIARSTGGVGVPTITAFTPNSGNAGATGTVSLTGTTNPTDRIHSIPIYLADGRFSIRLDLLHVE